MFSRRSSRRLSVLSAALLFVALFFLTATDGPERIFAQAAPLQLIAGRNVNMVAGTEWPNGDPFLQRQNEPSIAASTRNPMHLLGGSNDYRTIDLAGIDGSGETGDAWLGLYKSFDGGDRWISTLVPGYPDDTSAAGLASPLHGYQAGADPVVRAGTNGLFYYSGIVFDRPATPGAPVKSRVFVARFIDNNNKEAGDPIAYLGAAAVASNSGTTGAFIDKPWMAVDIPRGGARTCQIRTPGDGGRIIRQSVTAGNVYLAYSVISGTGADLRSTIMFSNSSDCGATWSRPIALSDPGDRVNQGATIAIDPTDGTVHVAWRQFGLSSSAPDAITITSAPAGSQGFKRLRKVRHFMAHHTEEQIEHWLAHKRRYGRDHKPRDDRDRHDAQEASGAGRGKGGPKTPPIVDASEVDSFDQPTLEDRFRTNAYPTMAVDGQGRVYLAWTERGFAGLNNSPTQGDARVVLSTSRDGLSWTAPQAVEDPIGATGTNTTGPVPGHQFMPSLAFAGGKLTLAFYDLRETASQTFGPWADDEPGTLRQTIDIRATQADPDDVPVFAPSVQVSQYQFGSRRGSTTIEQLQFNAPNLPMFQLGTVPFIGDYIDLAPSPAFVVDSRGRWRHNTAASNSTVFHVAWTDNRDVRKPAGGDWTQYKPPTNPFSTGDAAVCDPGFTASRNQNVYTSKLTQGLLAGSPGNAKPLSRTLPRGFVVFAQNTTDYSKTFRFTIQSQPIGGRASFNQLASDPLLTSVYASVPPRSTVARTVYATSSDPKSSVPVSVEESASSGVVLAGGLKSTVVLNPDIANPDIANPDIANPDIANPDIANAEVYNPDIANPDIANPDIANPDIANPDIANPDIANPDIANPDIANPDIANAEVYNPDIANPDIANPDIANPDIANGALTDVTWTITNTGNTTATFDVDLFFKNQPVPAGIKTQLILYRVYKTPEASSGGTSGAGCELQLKTQNVVVANILNPVFKALGTALTPDPDDPSESNATMWIEPGGTAKITLRIVDKELNDGETFNPVNDLKPVVTSEAYNTPDIAGGSPPATPPPTTEPPTTATPYLAFAVPPVGTAAGSDMPPFAVQYFVSAGTPGGADVPVTIALVTNPGGGTLLGTTTVVTNGSGVATFSGISISNPGNGYTISASASTVNAIPVVSGSINTLPVGPPPPTCNPLIVTSAADTTACGTLRAAITYANAHPGATIAFNIPGASSAAPAVIAVGSPLPSITGAVTVDGGSQPDYNVAIGPAIEVTRAVVSDAVYGFDIQASNTMIRCFAITGFPQAGVWAFQFLSGITIEHNTIGTDATGVAGKGNGEGVQLRYISNSYVQDNVIAGNARNGVLVEGGSGNSIRRNQIGLVQAGTATVANGLSGVTIYWDALNNSIHDNFISGNTAWGIDVQFGNSQQATGTIIRHNTIGLDATGNAALNLAGGVRLHEAPGTVIDGGNVISGNHRAFDVPDGNGGTITQHIGGPGILVSGSVMPVPTIRGNYIGTTADGTAARPNKYEGIVLEGPALIGGDQTGEGNLISGNGFAGWLAGTGILVAPGSDGSVIQGNIIGPSSTGAGLGNGYSGITVYSGVADVTIGGPTSSAGNVIAGNPAHGIAVYAVGGSPASNVMIQSNRIGLNQLDAALGNGGWGVWINDAANVAVGGSGVGNIVGYNTTGGVYVGGNASGVTIVSNSIADNGGLGIDVESPGIAAAPVLTNVTTAGFDYSVPDGAYSYTIEWFTSSTCDPSGSGEGQVPLDTFGGLTSGTIETSLPLGGIVTVTATNGAGTTEFSNCATVAAPTAVTVVLGNLSQVYDGSPKPVSVTPTPAAAYSVTYNGSETVPSAAGSYTVVATVTSIGYTGSASGTLVISKATPVITWANPAVIAVGTPLGWYELNATASVPGTLVYTPAAGAMLPVGTHNLSLTFTPTDATNYNTAAGAVTLGVVGPAPGHVFVLGLSGGTVNGNFGGGATAAGGTNPVSGASVANGEQVTISASGVIKTGIGTNGPNGSGTGTDLSFLAPARPAMSLVARIAGGSWQFVGAGPTILTATASGVLELAVNDSNFGDNGGWFDVVIQQGIFVPGTAGGTVRALTWPTQACPSCGANPPGGTVPVDSGIVLALDEVVTVSANGVATYYGGGFVGPDGAEVGRLENLVPSTNWGAPTASLMARVGSGGWQFVGSGPTQIRAYQAGTLEFAVNDSNYADNGGGWNVSVTRPSLPTATVTPSAPFSAVYNGAPKSVAFTTSPGGLGLDVRYDGGSQPSAIGAYFVRAKVTGGVNAGAGSAILTIGSTLAIGGGGGGPYTRSCGPGVFATGFDANNGSSYGLWNARLRCEGGGSTERFVLDNNQTMNLTSTCGPNQVMVGFHGYQGLSDVTAGPFVKALGARCQDRSGVGPVTTIAPIGYTYQDAVGPYDCPAGQAVTGVVGGAGGVLDSTALVCSVLPAITSVLPSTVAAFQYITLEGNSLPAVSQADILFSQGGPEFAADYAWTVGSSRVIARVPTGVLALGSATVRLKNAAGTVTTNSVPITISAAPGAPVLHNVYTACFAGSATTTLNQSQQFMIEAAGTGTDGTEFRWTNGVSTIQHLLSYATSGPTGRLGTCASLPGGVTPGAWTLSIRSYTGAWSTGTSITIQ